MSTSTQFNARERGFLLRQRGIGEGMLAGIEALGIVSLEQLATVGADALCERMQRAHGWDVWGNRRRALQAAIDLARATGTCRPPEPSTCPGPAHGTPEPRLSGFAQAAA